MGMTRSSAVVTAASLERDAPLKLRDKNFHLKVSLNERNNLMTKPLRPYRTPILYA